MRKASTDFTSKRRDRFYRRAMILAMTAIIIFAVSFSIYWAFKGVADKIWILLLGCAVSCLVILVFQRGKGVLDPAFSVPFFIYLAFITG